MPYSPLPCCWSPVTAAESFVAVDELPRAWGGAVGSGELRSQPEDFQVFEIPVCEPGGEGEHLWLKLRKTGANTDWVARQLARGLGIKPQQVSYAGLKDRNAITEQWFSLHLPGMPDPDLSTIPVEGVEWLQWSRHNRKLRRGALKGNRFQLRLRNWQGQADTLAQRIEQVRGGGVPNYFGEQRFGRELGNLDQAQRMFAEGLRPRRHEKGLYLSAARSYLFNRVLVERVGAGDWNRARPDDFLQLDGRHGGFRWQPGDEPVDDRLAAMEIHPTGPLWGRGRSMAGERVDCWERELLGEPRGWTDGLERMGLQNERRALRVRVDGLEAREENGQLVLGFSLPAGAYATVVLRELLAYRDAGGGE